MRYQQSFPTVVPLYKAGYPRVTHPSATRVKLHLTEVAFRKTLVRLACVKHAASVHPEPGSNSHKKFVCSERSGFFKEVALVLRDSIARIYCFKGWIDFSILFVSEISFEVP